MGALIDPSEFPIKAADLDVDKIRSTGSSAKSLGSKLDTTTDAIQRIWSGLQRCYHAPEQESVYRVMVPATTAADQLKERMDKAATITSTYAGEVEGVRSRLETLQREAQTFRELALKGHERWGYKPIVMQTGAMITTVPSWGLIHEEWDEHTPFVERNTELLGQYEQLMVELSEAAGTCSTGLVGLMSPAAAKDFRDRVAEAERKAQEAAEKNPPALPAWGYPTHERRNCPEQVGDAVGNVFWSTVMGGAGLIGWDSETNRPFRDGQVAKQSWLGLVDALGSLALAASGPIGATLMFGAGGLTQLGVRNSFTEFMAARQRTIGRIGGGFVGIDPEAEDPFELWKRAPYQAGTESIINIGSMFLGGAGAGRGLAKAATSTARGARITHALMHTLEVRIPGGSWLLRNGTRAYRLSQLDLEGALKGTRFEVSKHIPEVPPTPKRPVTDEIFSERRTAAPETSGGGRGSGGDKNPPASPHPQSPQSPRSPHSPNLPETDGPVPPPRPKPGDWPEGGPVHGGPGRHANAVYEYTTGGSRTMNSLINDLDSMSPAQARQLLEAHRDALPPWVREHVEAIAARPGRPGSGLEGFDVDALARTANQVDALLDVIDNSPVHTGPVSSGQWLDPHEVASLRPGSTYTPNSFLSSSTNPRTAATYAAGAADEGLQSVVFRIQSRTGVDLGRISTSDEILFRPGTRFEVVGRGPLDVDDLPLIIQRQLGEDPVEIVLRELP